MVTKQLLVALLFTILAAPVIAIAAPPSFVFILADDMGSGDPTCYNPQSKISTPHIDRLAREGIRFTDAHSPSAVCTPTRYGVLTGRYCWRTRLKQGVLLGYSRSLIEPDRWTVAELLHRRGYATACIGKWHLGFQPTGGRAKVDYAQPLRPGPVTLGFDAFFGIPASLDMDPYVYVEDDHPLAPPTAHLAASKHRRQGGGGFWRAGAASPGFAPVDVLPRLAQEATDWLGQQSSEQPFFLYLPLSAPHTPWVPTDEFRGRSSAGWYGDFATQVDSVVGQVLAALDDAGLAENTLVIFTSDNGAHWLPGDVEKFGHRANLNYRGQKADVWEGGHRVPFIARLPGTTPPGATSDQLLCLTDFTATAAALVGIELPAGAAPDSVDQSSALAGETTPTRRSVVNHSVDGTFAIRAGQWKLIEGNLGSGGFSKPRRVEPEPDGPQGQLYDLEADLGEQHNLYEKRPDVVERLSGLLDEIRTGDGAATP